MIAWVLIVAGCTTIITQSALFFPLRERLERSRFQSTFLSCPMCVGFWVGLVASLVFKLGVAPALTLPWVGAHWVTIPMRWVADGCAASIVCWVTYVVLKALGSDKL